MYAPKKESGRHTRQQKAAIMNNNNNEHAKLHVFDVFYCVLYLCGALFVCFRTLCWLLVPMAGVPNSTLVSILMLDVFMFFPQAQPALQTLKLERKSRELVFQSVGSQTGVQQSNSFEQLLKAPIPMPQAAGDRAGRPGTCLTRRSKLLGSVFPKWWFL